MGDPKRPKKKYKKPLDPWRRSRIEEERVLLKEFGLKNKKELWKAESILRNFRQQTKKLIGSKSEQSKKEEKQLLGKLERLGLIDKGKKVDDVLNLDKKDILNRRLQSIILKQNLSKSIRQARQFIVHGHIMVKDRVIRVPSYLVSLEEEGQIVFNKKSSLNKEDHPEKIIVMKKEKKEKAKKEKIRVKKEVVKVRKKEKKGISKKEENEEVILEEIKA